MTLKTRLICILRFRSASLCVTDVIWARHFTRFCVKNASEYAAAWGAHASGLRQSGQRVERVLSSTSFMGRGGGCARCVKMRQNASRLGGPVHSNERESEMDSTKKALAVKVNSSFPRPRSGTLDYLGFRKILEFQYSQSVVGAFPIPDSN